jgi:hypothetical protein
VLAGAWLVAGAWVVGVDEAHPVSARPVIRIRTNARKINFFIFYSFKYFFNFR